MKKKADSVMIGIVAIVCLVIVGGAWFYVEIQQQRASMAIVPVEAPYYQSTIRYPSNNPPYPIPQTSAPITNQPGNNNSGSLTLIYPTATAAQKTGNSGSQFKIQYAAVTTITSPGCTAGLGASFQEYFGNEQQNESWCYNQTAADGSGHLKVVSLTLTLYGFFPQLTMDFPVTDPDSGATDYLTAQPFLPFTGNTAEFTPVGSIHPTGRITFLVPTETTGTTVYYKGGTFLVDFNNQTITLESNNPIPQSNPTTISPVSLYIYSNSIQTYNDQSGAFSAQYPGQFSINEDLTGDPIDNYGTYLDSELTEIDANDSSGFSISPAVNGTINFFDIEYSSPGDQTSCENPNNQASDGGVPPTVINGVNWYKATMLSNNGTPSGGTQGIDDLYQTYQNGKCWAFDFNWDASANQAPSYGPIGIFEASVLNTFHISNAGALPDTSGSDAE